jgi:alkanesulfonate monooxygenase SsuD/methylene tetrahydromethanopterin reductase-like flavin-dependent oxidoreductase (luciferase family)
MRLGAYFDGFASVTEVIKAAEAAEQAGAASLWFAQHMGYREAYICAAVAAQVTAQATVVPVAISPYLWPPLPAAMSTATLAELAPGRTELAVSVGNILNLGESGREPVKPIKVMREYVYALRALLAGEAVTVDGEMDRLRGAHMDFLQGVKVPIHVASTGRQMLELAGEIGDGVLLSAGLSLAATRRCLEYAAAGAQRKGREISALRRVGLIFLYVSEDGESAKTMLRRKIAYLFRSRGHAENIKSSGLDIDHAAIIAAHSRRDFEAAVSLLPEKAASVFGIAGTPSECHDRLQEYLATGLDEVVIGISGDVAANRSGLKLLREHNLLA